MVVFGDLAVLTRPVSRRGRARVASTARASTALGLAVGASPRPAPSTAATSSRSARTAYVGRGGRTNDAGIAQLAALVAPLGWTVVPVPVTTVLHLKSAVTALPDGTIVGTPRVDGARTRSGGARGSTGPPSSTSAGAPSSCPPTPRARPRSAVPRPRRRPGPDHRVREARGLRDLPVVRIRESAAGEAPRTWRSREPARRRARDQLSRTSTARPPEEHAARPQRAPGEGPADDEPSGKQLAGLPVDARSPTRPSRNRSGDHRTARRRR